MGLYELLDTDYGFIGACFAVLLLWDAVELVYRTTRSQK